MGASFGTLRKGVNSAFQFAPAPAARPRIAWVRGKSGAGLASDAGIACVVQRQVRQAARAGAFPDLRPGPVRKRADLEQCLPAGQTVLLDLPEIRARGRLRTAQTGEPEIERLERFHQRSDLTKLAASSRVRLIQQTVLRFLLCDDLFRENIHQIQAPFLSQTVAKLVGGGEVVARFQKKNRKPRQSLTQEIEHDEVLSLETARETSVGRSLCLVENSLQQLFHVKHFDFLRNGRQA